MSVVNRRHDKIFDILHTVATDVVSPCRQRHAAAIVHHGKIVSIGANRDTTHPFQHRFAVNKKAIYIHAELDAINKALKSGLAHAELSNSSLYVLRLKYSGQDKHSLVRGLSKPCTNGCQQAIAAFDIRKVFYTTDDGNYESI